MFEEEMKGEVVPDEAIEVSNEPVEAPVEAETVATSDETVESEETAVNG